MNENEQIQKTVKEIYGKIVVPGGYDHNSSDHFYDAPDYMVNEAVQAIKSLIGEVLLDENKRHLKQHKQWLENAREAKARDGMPNKTDMNIEHLMIHIGVIKERIAMLKGKTTTMWDLDRDIWGEDAPKREIKYEQ